MKNTFVYYFIILFLISTITYGQSNGCLSNYKDKIDNLLPVELIKKYSKNYEMDHYVNAAGTDYLESQFFWYPNDETTHMVKLYGIKIETSKNPLKKFKRKVEKKSDEIYNYEYADGIGDYAYWTTSNMDLESATTTDAKLNVLFNNESFVVQADLGKYEKSQSAAKDIANHIISKCK